MRADSQPDGKGIIDLGSAAAMLVKTGQVEAIVAAAVGDHEDDAQRPALPSTDRKQKYPKADAEQGQIESGSLFHLVRKTGAMEGGSIPQIVKSRQPEFPLPPNGSSKSWGRNNLTTLLQPSFWRAECMSVWACESRILPKTLRFLRKILRINDKISV